MANMSYCRWHNTSLALQDCVNSLEGIEESEEGFNGLSQMEQHGLLNIVRNSVELLSQLPHGVLANAGIDLRMLPTQEDIASADTVEMRYAA